MEWECPDNRNLEPRVARKGMCHCRSPLYGDEFLSQRCLCNLRLGLYYWEYLFHDELLRLTDVYRHVHSFNIEHLRVFLVYLGLMSRSLLMIC